MNYQLIKNEGHPNPMTTSELQERMESWPQCDYSTVLIAGESKMAGLAPYQVGR